jgi:protein O-GlcNAc transferase
MSATVSPELPLDAELAQAIAEHQAGRHEQAEELYLRILQAQPYHAIANHNLGLLAGQVGQHQAGLPYLLKALSVNPDEGQFWLSYADGLLKAGQPDEALDIVETAIQRGLDNAASQALKQRALDAVAAAALLPTQAQIDHIVGLYHAGAYVEMESATLALLDIYPESAFGWSVLGTALQIQGKDALPALRKTVTLTPGDAEAHSSLGNALQSSGQFDAALACYATALEIKPDFAEALSNMGGAHQAKAQLDDAAACYRRALAIRPDYAMAHFNLGNTLKAQGQFEQAADSYRAALALIPDDAEVYCNLGNTLHALERHEEAVQAYDSALALNPDYSMAHGNLGAAYFKLGRYNEAQGCYRRALKVAPYDAEAHNGLGQCLQALKQHHDALAAFRSAIAWKPHFAAAHSNMGSALLQLDQAPAAVLSYRKSLSLEPDSAAAHTSLALALAAGHQPQEAEAMHLRAIELAPSSIVPLRAFGEFLKDGRRYDQAVALYQQALLLDPLDVELHNAVGMTRQAQGEMEMALDSYRKILEINPDSAIAWCNLGSVQQTRSLFKEARGHYERALAIEPRFAGAHFNLGSCLMECGLFLDAMASYAMALDIEPHYRQAHVNMSAAQSNLGRTEDAVETCRQALKINPQWDSVHSNMLFLLAHSARLDAAALLAEHRAFADQFEAPLRASWPVHANSRDPQRRLRIGFVSADFNNHSVAHFITPVLENLVGSPELEMFFYYNNHLNDYVTERLRSLTSGWHQVEKMPDDELAALIAADGIDILIDLSGHTGHNRLLTFARKPAPLQASWIGYPSTTGLDAMDYYLTERFLFPTVQLEDDFTESFAYLPASAPFLPSADAPEVNSLPALGNGYVTYGSFNRANKLSLEVIALWARLMAATPHSRMLIGGISTDEDENKIAAWFAAGSIDRERLIFERRSGMKTYLALHHRVDLCLDTFPYTGGTTTLHSLWMGIPTLTLSGATTPARVSAALLSHVHLQAFVAHDADEFVQKGILAANNINLLASLRGSLRQLLANSALGQPPLIADGLKTALRVMWQRWCAGMAPASFEIEAVSAADLRDGTTT